LYWGIGGYSWLLVPILLVVILLVDIGVINVIILIDTCGYSIVSHWWLLMDIHDYYNW